MEKEKDIVNKNENTRKEKMDSSTIENAHASGDGSLGMDEEILLIKKPEEKHIELKKDAEQY